MKRIRLDIGALTAVPDNGGSFMFFLYKEDMDKCLPVPLSPPDMHAVLANFKQVPTKGISIQSAIYNILQEYKIELLEVQIVRNDKDELFQSELLLFDGEKETRQICGFVDGVILAKKFSCPIYTSQELMDSYSTTMDLFSENIVKNEEYLNDLKEQLSQAVAAEDYEKAAKINKAIEKLSKKK